MPVFNARLTEQEIERLKEIADGQGLSMADVLRRWIAGEPLTATLYPLATFEQKVNGDVIVTEVPMIPAAKPSFLIAPNDDCAECDHDRQSYHLAGKCTAPIGRGRICECPAFVEVLFSD